MTAYVRIVVDGSPTYHEYEDPWTEFAVAQILDTYGDVVDLKPKALRKFGRTENADDDVKTTVGTFGSVSTPNVNETYSTTNDIDKIVSSSGSDTEVLHVEGHTINVSTGDLTFAVQEVTLTGQTPVTLGTPLARLSRMKVKKGTFASPASNLVGNIYGYASDGVTVTSGVPQTNTAVKARIVAGGNTTAKAATSISSVDYWIISQIQASCGKNNSSTVNVDCDVEVRQLGGVFLPEGLEFSTRAGGSQSIVIDFRPYLVIPPNSDVRLVATSNTANATVSGYISGALALIRE